MSDLKKVDLWSKETQFAAARWNKIYKRQSNFLQLQVANVTKEREKKVGLIRTDQFFSLYIPT